MARVVAESATWLWQQMNLFCRKASTVYPMPRLRIQPIHNPHTRLDENEEGLGFRFRLPTLALKPSLGVKSRLSQNQTSS